MYLCRLSSFQEETEGQKVTDFPADGTDVLQCRHHSQLPVISEAACAGYHVGVDLTSDLFPVQHADHEELLPEYDSRQPILATLSLFYAVGRWNSYADNMYYTKSANLKLIQYKLYQLVASAAEAQTSSLADTGSAIQSTPEVLQAASIMFVTIPIIIIYPFLQKYFVQGTMIGAVKG